MLSHILLLCISQSASLEAVARFGHDKIFPVARTVQAREARQRQRHVLGPHKLAWLRWSGLCSGTQKHSVALRMANLAQHCGSLGPTPTTPGFPFLQVIAKKSALHYVHVKPNILHGRDSLS
jgi:hypothetical protein